MFVGNISPMSVESNNHVVEEVQIIFNRFKPEYENQSQLILFQDLPPINIRGDIGLSDQELVRKLTFN